MTVRQLKLYPYYAGEQGLHNWDTILIVYCDLISIMTTPACFSTFY